MKIESLKELKAKNANDNEAEEAVEVEEVKETELVDDYVEEVEEPEAVEEEAEPDEEGGEEETEIESWMQSEETEQSGFKPSAEAKKRRLNEKALKATVKEKDSELEQLRAENEKLKASTQVEEKIPPRPKREDFDFDDDAYDAAVDEWNDKKLEIKLKNHTSKSMTEAEQKRNQEQQVKLMNERVNSHYEKAGELVSANKVSAEAYKAADGAVRSELEVIYPGQGDLVADQIISTLAGLGDGSEKVMYQLGVNAEKRGRLLNLLQTDQLGAMAYLGQLQSSVSTPTKRKSNAPKPAPNVNGEGKSSGKAGTLLKQYQKAGKEGDIQARISLKRKAKAQGIDVTNWS